MNFFDQYTGVTERYITEDDRLHIVRGQDVQSLIDQNKQEASDLPSMFSEAKWRKAASVPTVVAEQWAKECGAAIGTPEWAEHCKRKLLSGDFAAFNIKGF